MVAVTDQGALLGRAYVSGGVATVTLSPPPPSPTTLDVVVTGHNLVPWEGTVEVIVPEGPWLSHRAHTIDDSAGGNGDGVLNPGESVVVAVTVENIGVADGTGLSSTLTTTSLGCTITDGAADFPDVAIGNLATTLPDHFSYTLDAAASHGDLVELALEWSADGGYSGGTSFVSVVCAALQITGITVTEITESSARINWTTSVPATSRVTYGITTPPQQVAESSTLTTSHSVLLSDLGGCTRYLFEVASESPGCYHVTDDNAGAFYSFTSGGRLVVFFDDAESGSGDWTAEPPWAISNEASSSGTHSWSDSPGGSYANGINTRLTSPVIDLSGLAAPELRFFHTYSFEACCDFGIVEATADGGVTWTQLAIYGGNLGTWTEETIDLSAFAGSEAVQIGFRVATDGSVTLDGWHIDDIEVSAARSCSLGMVQLDEQVYPCGATISITVTDFDLNTDDTVQETASVLIASDSEPTPELVWVTETGPSATTFVGSIETTSEPILDGFLSIAGNDLITATYEDADDGTGTPATATTTARADCAPPVIADVQVPFLHLTSSSALVFWRTDEEATSVVTIQGSTPVSVPAASELATEHAVTLSGLSGCTTYSFSVTSCDRWGYCATDDNDGAFYVLETPTADVYLNEDFEGTAAAWSHGGSDDQWQLGTPSSGPGAAHGGIGAYATILSGPYLKSSGVNSDDYLVSPVIDLSGADSAALTFWHWYDIFTDSISNGEDDGAWLEITSDGGASWQVLEGGYNNTLDAEAPYPGGPCWAGTTAGWEVVQVDLSAYTGAQVQLRFRFFEDDDTGTAGAGWYIDDVRVATQTLCGPYPVHLSHVIHDPIGNLNGVVDPGEQIILPVTLTNIGVETASSVTGRLSSATAGVLVEQAESGFPDMAPAASGLAEVPYMRIMVDERVPCGSLIELELVSELDDPAGNPGMSQSTFTIPVGTGGPYGCQPFNAIYLDRELYSCDDLVTVRVADPDLNLDPGLPDTASAELSSSTQPLPQVLVLTETGPDTGVFTGELAISVSGGSGVLLVSQGDTITAVYHDQSAGGAARDYTALATVASDCTPPVISAVEVTSISGTGAVVNWSTNEPADSLVEWGTTPSLGSSALVSDLEWNHTVVIDGLSPCTEYYFRVSSTDSSHNTVIDDNNGSLYSFESASSQLVLRRRFEGTAYGWSHSGTHDQWQHGAPTSGPGQAHSGSNLFATNLAGPYTKSGTSTNGENSLFSEEIDLSGLSSPTLSFWHWYDIYTPTPNNGAADGAWLEISADGGTTWQVVTPDGGYNNTLDEEAPHGLGPCWAGATAEWQLVRADLTPWAGATVQLRFRFFEDDDTGTAAAGWYIDDLVIETSAPCGPYPAYLSHQIIDTPVGNNDGIVDSGERISLPLTLNNYGIEPAFSVSARASSLTPGVTVDIPEAGFPDLAPGASAGSTAPHLRFMVDPSVPCGSQIELELEVSFTSTDGEPGQIHRQLVIDVGTSGVGSIPAAVLNGGCAASYFMGGCGNRYSEYAAILDADPGQRFATTVITDLDPATLAAFDVLLLPDNIVLDADLAAVAAWFVPGKTIIAIDSAVCYAAYAGLLWPGSAGSNGYSTYWDYNSSSKQTVVRDDPITSDYAVGDEVGGVYGDAQAFSSLLPADSVPLLVNSSATGMVTVVYRDVPDQGRIILMGPFAGPPADCDNLIRAAASSVTSGLICNPFDPSPIFSDGFESGDTSAWSRAAAK
jgi:hypothetical protein